MKKNLWNGGLFPRKLPRKPIVMKTLLALFLFMNVSVVSTYAQQQKKMDISVDKMPLIDVLVQIRQMSGFAFVYDSDAVKKAAPVSLKMKNVTVQEILDKCFAGTLFTYLMEDNLVIIKLQKSPVVGKQVENQKITGVVTDEKKMPLPGVTVVVKGVTLGTATDMNGRFSLLLPTIKDVSLLFSFIGTIDATEAAFCRALRVTLTGSTIPASIISQYTSL